MPKPPAYHPTPCPDFERGEELGESILAQLRTACEKAGLEFIAEDGGGPGVRLAKRKSKRR